MKQYDVYGIGNALVDTEYEIDEAFLDVIKLQKGVMTLIETEQREEILHQLEVKHEHEVIHQSGGGSAANTIVAVQQFGCKGFYSCKVADDAVGNFFMQDLVTIGVDSNKQNTQDEGHSGQCISMITNDAERTMASHLGISQKLSVAELDEEALKQSRYLYIEGYLVTSPTAFEAALKAQQIAKQSGVIVSVTLSDPAIVGAFKDAFDTFADAGIDLVFCNEEEAMIWTASESAEEAFGKLKTVCKQVAMTCGKDGAMVFDGTTMSNVAGEPTEAVDTTGAGDMFAGAFLASLSKGSDFPTAAAFANKYASKIVSRFGARLDSAEIAG